MVPVGMSRHKKIIYGVSHLSKPTRKINFQKIKKQPSPDLGP
jgi:hypothetical protein